MEVLQRFECLNCGAVHEGSTSPEQRKCCKEPSLKLLSVTRDPDVDYNLEISKCYEDIINIMKCYLDLPEDYYKFISTWIIGTYFHQSFSSYPFLFFNAMRGSGKTRLLKFISSLGAKSDGSVQNDISESALFRTPPGTTICIDECERIGHKEKSTLRELLNAAYKKGVKVKRVKKVRANSEEKYVIEEFEPYIPIALANINGIDEVLEDRAITLVLEKSNNPYVTKKVEDFVENKKIQQIKRTLDQASVVCAVSLCQKTYITAWNSYIDCKYNDTNIIYNNSITNNINNTTQDIEKAQKELELFNKIDGAGIDGRNFELLFPLMIIGNEIGDDVLNDVIKIGINLIKEKKKEESNESVDVSLIQYIASMEDESVFTYIPLRSVLSGFRAYLGETDSEDSWLNSKWLGRALKRLNMVGDKRRLAGGKEVILNISRAREQMRIFK